jgi:hypothetical protein
MYLRQPIDLVILTKPFSQHGYELQIALYVRHKKFKYIKDNDIAKFRPNKIIIRNRNSLAHPRWYCTQYGLCTHNCGVFLTFQVIHAIGSCCDGLLFFQWIYTFTSVQYSSLRIN